MAKFAIAKRTTPLSKVSPSVSKAVDGATPLTHAFATKIMSYYTPVEADPNLSTDEQNIQDLFNVWPNDETSNRLAQLTAAITGFAPAVNPSAAGFPIGSLFKVGNVVYAVAYLNGTYVYGINNTATTYQTLTIQTNMNLAPYAVTRAEAGVYAKAILSVKGVALFSYVTASFGAPAATAFLSAVGTTLDL